MSCCLLEQYGGVVCQNNTGVFLLEQWDALLPKNSFRCFVCQNDMDVLLARNIRMSRLLNVDVLFAKTILMPFLSRNK